MGMRLEPSASIRDGEPAQRSVVAPALTERVVRPDAIHQFPAVIQEVMAVVLVRVLNLGAPVPRQLYLPVLLPHSEMLPKL